MPDKQAKKILVINGSPKREKSFTMTVTRAFVEGLEQETGSTAEYVNISDMNVIPCRGCLSCWGRTAGECVIKGDDIPMLKSKLEEADFIVESFPLFFFGLPGTMKVVTDRLLGMLSTYRGEMRSDDDEQYHRLRVQKEGQRFAVISSCGFSESAEVFAPLKGQIDLILGKKGYTMICCPELKALIDTGKERKLPMYLSKIRNAGAVFAKDGTLSDEMTAELSKPPFQPQTYRMLTENFWKEQEGSGTHDKNSG